MIGNPETDGIIDNCRTPDTFTLQHGHRSFFRLLQSAFFIYFLHHINFTVLKILKGLITGTTFDNEYLTGILHFTGQPVSSYRTTRTGSDDQIIAVILDLLLTNLSVDS